MATLAEDFDALRNKVFEELKTAIDDKQEATAKWILYEQEYILPCFELAKKSGIDLQKLVQEKPGKNCIILLIEELQSRIK